VSKAHVLIIEDHKDSAEVLGRLLHQADVSYRVIERPTKLTSADVQDVNAIFLDLDMPDMDGYGVFNMLRQQLVCHAPVIAYTVNTNEKATTRQLGFNGMIAKPLDASCFPDQLERILNGQPVWDEC
jgi:two-component system cell cycle response regulator DivK